VLSEEADVVLGKRPKENSGMLRWRKAIEEFGQFLLSKTWGQLVAESVAGFEPNLGLLPDGQADVGRSG
jgi:hypothetical protein